MATAFQYRTDRDLWERQGGERAEEFDWFQHWLHDGHRRSYARTAEKFEVKRDRVARVGRQNRWADRAAAYRANQSRQVNERFNDIAEAALVPFAQGMARLAAHAATTDPTEVSPEKALTAATNAMRVIKEPSIRELLLATGSAGDTREYDMVELILNRLQQSNPDAYDEALDALENPAAGAQSPLELSDGDG